MEKFFYFLIIFVSTLAFVNGHKGDLDVLGHEATQSIILNKAGKRLEDRFSPPVGFERLSVGDNTFAKYLRSLPLKPHGSKVLYFNKEVKSISGVYIAVVDMEIGNRDLQQCADAVMRLRGEYLYGIRAYDRIHFNFVSDGKPRYYKDYVNGDYSYKKFRKYMNYIFSYANTSSLCDELQQVAIQEMEIGDVFIQKGRPFGHAILVVDMAINKKTGEKVFMLAQSYMPAQETQVLINRGNPKISPWYKIGDNKTIDTPEWVFNLTDLKRFKE